MAGASYAYEGLSVAIREDSAAGLATLGVVADGAFIPFQSVKLGGFHEDLKEGREQQQAEQAQQPQPEPQPEQQQEQQQQPPLGQQLPQ